MENSRNFQAEVHKLKQQVDSKVEETKRSMIDLQTTFRIEKEGWLTKSGGKNANKWQKRFFKLAYNVISYYKDNKTLTHPAGVIELTETSVQRTETSVFNRPFVFAVQTPKRTYYLCGTTEDEVETWISCIMNWIVCSFSEGNDS